MKLHHFRAPLRLKLVTRGIFAVTEEFGWELQAWAVFSNHYHFITLPPAGGANTLDTMLSKLHTITATWINERDRKEGRKVWHNFYESSLTYQRSHLTRLSYVHQNAVKHGLVRVASDYPWCSARWLEAKAPTTHVRLLKSLKIDRVNVYDDYTPVLEESGAVN